jgi:hypothetical protein
VHVRDGYSMGESLGRRNAEAYEMMFEIENGLREFIIEKMHAHYGSQWLKRNVPADVREDMKKGKAFERSIVWTKAGSYHPIYYTDFPHLRKLITQSDNWRAVFQGAFGPKLHIEAALSDLEPIRNKIAHCRLVAENDIDCLRTFHNALSEALGRPIGDALASALEAYGSIPERLKKLGDCLTELVSSMENATEYPRLDVLRDISGEWWFDDTYLLHDLTDISGLM